MIIMIIAISNNIKTRAKLHYMKRIAECSAN